MKNKYPLGYMPKVEYYQYKVNRAIEEMDTDMVKFYTNKLVYFMGRQQKLELFG